MKKEEIVALLHKRHPSDHKGIFGHALIIAGSRGKFGAAVLASQACLRSGVGLLTTHLPAGGELVLQISVPEAMVDLDADYNCCTAVFNPEIYSAIGIGPGLGTDKTTEHLLFDLLKNLRKPCVLDADALNLISRNKELFELIPPYSILTPHPKEFDRLAGPSSDSDERLRKAMDLAHRLQCYIVLKGGPTAICKPDKTVTFNITGNPGMGTAGSGDVLTGFLTGLLAQSYSPEETCLIGVFLHGLAGDKAAEALSQEAMIASDIIDNLGKAFQEIWLL